MYNRLYSRDTRRRPGPPTNKETPVQAFTFEEAMEYSRQRQAHAEAEAKAYRLNATPAQRRLVEVGGRYRRMGDDGQWIEGVALTRAQYTARLRARIQAEKDAPTRRVLYTILDDLDRALGPDQGFVDTLEGNPPINGFINALYLTPIA